MHLRLPNFTGITVLFGPNHQIHTSGKRVLHPSATVSEQRGDKQFWGGRMLTILVAYKPRFPGICDDCHPQLYRLHWRKNPATALESPGPESLPQNLH